MFAFEKLETFGGICSMLTGLVCAGIGWRDWQADESIWKIWAVMCLVLIVNGIAMVRHVRPLAVLHPEEEGSTTLAAGLHAKPLPGEGGPK